MELLGIKCIDDGTCHHMCKDKCFRRECCSPFPDYEGEWAYENEQPSPAPELDFSRPLETEKGDPVKWICADVIEYKSARVCVAQDTGLVYSSPYIGLKIRNVVSAPELERPSVTGWLVPISGMYGHTSFCVPKGENNVQG